jgi:hypothetical protein
MVRMNWSCAGLAAILAACLGCGGGEATASSGEPVPGPDVVVGCPEGFADCDGEASNGCEASLETSALNCGACGVACEATNADALCSAGACVAICNAGFADCDGDESTGCEVDTVNDPAHCGSCANACGASCAYAVCDIAVLASAQDRPAILALDDEAVYWSSQGTFREAGGSVNRVPKDGGPPTVIASEQAITLGIAVDATSVYWTNLGLTPGSGAVMRAPKLGGPAVTLAEGQPTPFPIVIDGDWLYWVNQGDPPDFTEGVIMRVATTVPDAAPEPLFAVTGRPISLCVGETAIYFTVLEPGDTERGSLQALAKNGAPGDPAAVLADDLDAPSGVLCMPENVYIRTSTSILAFPVAGGAPTTIVDDMTEPAIRLASDGTSLYWTAASPANQTVEAAALDGSSRRMIASGQTDVVDVAVDATSVYWTRFATSIEQGTGVVLKAPK